MRHLIAFALFFPLSVARADPTPADVGTARTLGEQGMEALHAKDFATAEDRFRRAEELYHAPTLALGLARALAGRGKLVAAYEVYGRIVREGAPKGNRAFQQAVEDATQERERLAPRIPTVVITVRGVSSAPVTLDGEIVPAAALNVARPVDPGSHVVRAEGAKDQTFEVAEGGRASVTVEIVAPVPPQRPVMPPPPRPLAPAPAKTSAAWPWLAVGTGAAGIATGTIAGILALNTDSELAQVCPDRQCAFAEQDAVDTLRSYRTISTIGFAIGAVGLTTGLVWLALRPRARIAPYVGTGAGIVGTF